MLIKVSVCGVCHTEIDEIEGRTPPRVYPVVPGHQVVGIVEKSRCNRLPFAGPAGFHHRYHTVWEPVVRALECLKPGGWLVILAMVRSDGVAGCWEWAFEVAISSAEIRRAGWLGSGALSPSSGDWGHGSQKVICFHIAGEPLSSGRKDFCVCG